MIKNNLWLLTWNCQLNTPLGYLLYMCSTFHQKMLQDSRERTFLLKFNKVFFNKQNFTKKIIFDSWHDILLKFLFSATHTKCLQIFSSNLSFLPLLDREVKTDKKVGLSTPIQEVWIGCLFKESKSLILSFLPSKQCRAFKPMCEGTRPAITASKAL